MDCARAEPGGRRAVTKRRMDGTNNAAEFSTISRNRDVNGLLELGWDGGNAI
jgi:hypothetical protein